MKPRFNFFEDRSGDLMKFADSIKIEISRAHVDKLVLEFEIKGSHWPECDEDGNATSNVLNEVGMTAEEMGKLLLDRFFAAHQKQGGDLS